jgi:hypothetical protein
MSVGNFYVNFSIKEAQPRQVADALVRARRRAIVTSSQGGYVVAYDEEADRQATQPILALGRVLSRELARPVLAVLNHDDDILCYWLFDGGELRDSYNSNPRAFDPDEGEPPWQAGNAQKLCAGLGRSADAPAVEAILRADYVFAVDRHQHLAETLGLPSYSVGLGYQYVSEGEFEDESGSGDLIYVGK